MPATPPQLGTCIESATENMSAMVGKRAPEFDLPCTKVPGSSRLRAELSNYRDLWLILVFYPRDFSLVCPTELTALSDRIEEFRRRGCAIVGISTDSIESHERWIATPKSKGGLAGLQFPLASDQDGSVSRAYGVYLEQQHIALRGLFIVDPNGVLQYQSVHNVSVGRRSDDVLRMLAALETGGMCPEDWSVGGTTLDPTKTLNPGSILGHYRIERKVGSGTFASVFRAHDTTLDRTVALKVFNPGSLATPLAALAEARSAAALNHPNVCTVYAADDSEGVPVIAMEFLDGQPLRAVLSERAFSSDEISNIARQVALGMAEAHRHGIVHGDLKPANIIVTRDGAAKVTDFGLARRAKDYSETEETQAWGLANVGKVAGTPRYMSPEQSRGEKVTTASDVFSFGLVLYEMFAREPAFAGENVLQVLSQIRQVDPGRYAEQIPKPFAPILRQALVRHPLERVISMATIADLLN